VTPLWITCALGNAQVAVALLDGGANIDFTTPARRVECPSFTPLMIATVGRYRLTRGPRRKPGAS
jgi:hypothetical protein